MKKLVLFSIFTVLIFGIFASIGFAKGAVVNPEDFITYKSPQGLFEVMLPKDIPLMKEFKEGVSYGDLKKGYMFAAGVRFFGEKDDVKVDLKYIENELNKAKKEIEDSKEGVVKELPKKYKDGMFMLVSVPKAPMKGMKEGEYCMFIFVKPKNEKSMAVIGYVPKEEYEGFKTKLDFIIDNLK